MRQLAEAYVRSEKRLLNYKAINHEEIIECFHEFYEELGKVLGNKWEDFIVEVLKIQSEENE